MRNYKLTYIAYREDLDYNDKERTSISVTFLAITDIKINSFSLLDVVGYTGENQYPDFKMELKCSVSSSGQTASTQSVYLNYKYSNPKFDFNSFNFEIKSGQTVTFTVSRVNRYFPYEHDKIITNIENWFKLLRGTKDVEAKEATNVGVETTKQSLPSFELDYDVLEEPFVLQKGVNDDYPFILGLATEYPDQEDKLIWSLQKGVNDDYPFILGLATEYPTWNYEHNVFVLTDNGLIPCDTFFKENDPNSANYNKLIAVQLE